MISMLLAGLVAATSPPTADVGDASRAYRGCLDDAAAGRDDGRTNPRFLARRVALQCRPELVRLVSAATADRTNLVREQLYQEKLGEEEAAAQAAILRHRQAGTAPAGN